MKGGGASPEIERLVSWPVPLPGTQLYLMAKLLLSGPQSVSECLALFNADCERETITAAAAQMGGIHQKATAG
jgi:hypothetical protein